MKDDATSASPDEALALIHSYLSEIWGRPLPNDILHEWLTAWGDAPLPLAWHPLRAEELQAAAMASSAVAAGPSGWLPDELRRRPFVTLLNG